MGAQNYVVSLNVVYSPGTLSLNWLSPNREYNAHITLLKMYINVVNAPNRRPIHAYHNGNGSTNV